MSIKHLKQATKQIANIELALVTLLVAIGISLAAPPQALAETALSGVSPRAQAANPNLAAAQSMYGVPSERVFTVTDADSIASSLVHAGRTASASSKCIVYLPKGTYQLSSAINVPENVVLVGEANTTVSPEAQFDILVNICGSVYGCTFDSKKLNLTTLKFLECKFSSNNGRIDKSTVVNSNRYGIVAIHSGCKNAVVSGVTVTKSYWSGISVMDAANVKLIELSTFSNNGTNGEGAGINITHADVETIKSCTINNNADKAVSTNSDPVSGYKQPGCTIGTITGCTMKNNKINGVYIKPKCTLNHFTNNTLIGNGDGLSAVAKTVVGTKGKAVIKDVANNTFKNSKNMQIKAVNKGAVIHIGNGNTITGGSKAGIEARANGKVVIKGNKNSIKKNKGAGFNIGDSGILTLTGKNNVISKNAHSAVYCVGKGKATISNATIQGRIYCTTKGKVTLKKTKLSGATNVGSGGKVVQK